MLIRSECQEHLCVYKRNMSFSVRKVFFIYITQRPTYIPYLYMLYDTYLDINSFKGVLWISRYVVWVLSVGSRCSIVQRQVPDGTDLRNEFTCPVIHSLMSFIGKTLLEKRALTLLPDHHEGSSFPLQDIPCHESTRTPQLLTGSQLKHWESQTARSMRQSAPAHLWMPQLLYLSNIELTNRAVPRNLKSSQNLKNH